jgi:hypothetical protein
MKRKLPEHAKTIFAVAHSNMAPKDEKPSQWWYFDKHKGWDYLTNEGYAEYERLKEQFPIEVKLDSLIRTANLRRNFESQAQKLVDFAFI